MAEEPMSGIRVCVGLFCLLFFGVMALEYWTWGEQLRLAAGDPEPALSARELKAAAPYLAVRARFMARWWLYAPLIVLVPMLLFVLLRKWSAAMSGFRERFANMDFKLASDVLDNVVTRRASSVSEEIAQMQQAFIAALAAHAYPETSVVLGLDKKGAPILMTDRQRSMHMQVLGYTGSGKTQSVLFPMMYQDARRLWNDPRTREKVHRTIVLVDAKGSIENEQMLASIAAATGRLDDLRIFSLNPGVVSHTYNPLYMSPTADPRQVAERVFSTFEFEVQYYGDMARELWVNLICAMASSGKQMTMLDAAAAISSQEVMARALALATDRAAIRAIESRYDQLGEKVGETYTGLLAQVNAYDHPAINVYNPDIVLEDMFQNGGLVGFSLNANAYKVQARAIGLIAMQDIQQVGAGRQMNRELSQAPAYIYADEFYNFAYEGFIDAVNKLRDANLSMALLHQSMADLHQVSPEFAQGVWDSTRNRVVLFQSDTELCDNLAASVGTRKNIVQTVRRSTDGFLNQESMLEASTREVDEYVLHPNQIKHLKMGQAYLVQTGLAESTYEHRWWKRRDKVAPSPTVAIGANLALMPPLPAASPPTPAPRDTTSGIGLHRMFVGGHA